MTKFLGVISNSAPRSPSDDRVLEFTDLELLTNFLINETQNLFYEFLQKMQFINDREILINENFCKLTEIHDFCQVLIAETLEIERCTDEVCCWLCRMENSINCLDLLPQNFVACKCTSNLERCKTLDMLVQLSQDVYKIQDEVGQVKTYEKDMPPKDSCSLVKRLFPFLDLHTKILEQIEQKINKITDLLNEVDGMFITARKRLKEPCYRKVSHEYASDC